MPEEFNVDRIATAEALAGLAEEWDDLLANSPANTLALTHLWQRTWWNIFGGGRELYVLTIRDRAGMLVGIAPLLRRKVYHRKLIPFYRLEFLATGENQLDEIDSDYLDFIVRAGCEKPVLERLFTYLVREAPLRWDELDLRWLSEQSTSLRLVPKLAEMLGLECGETQRVAGVAAALPAKWEEVLAQFPGRKRYAILKERKDLDRAGPVEVRFTRDRAGFESTWDILVDLHQQRWRADGKPGCFASPPFTDFHRRVGQELAGRGAAQIATLTFAGRPAAVRYLFRHARRVYDYQSGQAVHLEPHLKVGNVLVGRCVEEAVGEAMGWYDFLKGVSQYKERWAKEPGHQVCVRLARSGWREQTRRLIESGIGCLKAWRPDRRTPNRVEWVPSAGD